MVYEISIMMKNPFDDDLFFENSTTQNNVVIKNPFDEITLTNNEQLCNTRINTEKVQGQDQSRVLKALNCFFEKEVIQPSLPKRHINDKKKFEIITNNLPSRYKAPKRPPPPRAFIRLQPENVKHCVSNFTIAEKEEDEKEEDEKEEAELDHDDIYCPICFDMFMVNSSCRKISKCGLCHKSFCFSCLEDVIKKFGNECPMCRETIVVERNLDLESKISTFETNCLSCKKLILIRDLNEHQNICESECLKQEASNLKLKSSFSNIQVHKNEMKSDFTTWACRLCTYQNKSNMNTCEICFSSLSEDGILNDQTNCQFNDRCNNSELPDKEFSTSSPFIASMISLGSLTSEKAYNVLFKDLILLRQNSKVFFRKWKIVLLSIITNNIDRTVVLLHDPSFLKNGVPNDKNAIKVLTLHRFMTLEKINETKDVIVEKTLSRTGTVYRKTSSPKKIYRSRLFENPISQIQKSSKVLEGFTTNAKNVNIHVTFEIGSQSKQKIAKILDILYNSIQIVSVKESLDLR